MLAPLLVIIDIICKTVFFAILFIDLNHYLI